MFGSERRAVVSFGLFALIASCSGPDDSPEPPDVSALLAAYSSPPGTVDPARPSPWLQTAQTQLDMLGGGQGRLVIASIVTAAMARVDRAGLPSGRDGLVPTRLDGIARVEVKCGEATDATASVAVAIVDGELAPLVWGTAHRCPLWEGEGVRASYDGTFAIYRYGGGNLFVRVDGTITGTGSPMRLDFRLYGGLLETRVVTVTGAVIAAREGTDVVARAANGTFRCASRGGSCR